MTYTEFRNYKHYLVTGNIKNVSREDADAITARIMLAAYAGGNSSVWHHSALHFGHKCHCFPCSQVKS